MSGSARGAAPRFHPDLALGRLIPPIVLGPRLLRLATRRAAVGGEAPPDLLVEDLAIPDRPFTFGQLIKYQAAGDASVLADHGRPVLRLHLHDVEAGLTSVREVLA